MWWLRRLKGWWCLRHHQPRKAYLDRDEAGDLGWRCMTCNHFRPFPDKDS